MTGNVEVKSELIRKGFSNVMNLHDAPLSPFQHHFEKTIVLDTEFNETIDIVNLLKKANNYAPIIIVTHNKIFPSEVYKNIGVRHVIYSNSNNIDFLLN